ncbi:hypothetical protein KCU87_g485, partial [Aureobasidium melanogenum]
MHALIALLALRWKSRIASSGFAKFEHAVCSPTASHYFKHTRLLEARPVWDPSPQMRILPMRPRHIRTSCRMQGNISDCLKGAHPAVDAIAKDNAPNISLYNEPLLALHEQSARRHGRAHAPVCQSAPTKSEGIVTTSLRCFTGLKQRLTQSMNIMPMDDRSSSKTLPAF